MSAWLCLQVQEVYQPGDPPPAGYLAWHYWARAQVRGGLRQRRCKICQRWKFPQEYPPAHPTTGLAARRCLECAA